MDDEEEPKSTQGERGDDSNAVKSDGSIEDSPEYIRPQNGKQNIV